MRVPVLALSWSFGTILALQSPIHAQAADPQLPVSMERIRAGLNQPPSRLQIFDPTMGLPSVGELLMNGIEHIRSAVVDCKRGRAERRARKEVDGALAAFARSASAQRLTLASKPGESPTPNA